MLINVDPNRIVPVNGTFREGLVDKIVESMSSAGWVGPPILAEQAQSPNRNLSHVAWTGSHRLAAAIKAGLPTVPVQLVDIDALAEAGHKPGLPRNAFRDAFYDYDEALVALVAVGDSLSAEILRQEIDKRRKVG